MEITSIVRDSLIDFPGKASLVLFNNKCNFKCPSCYAKQLFNLEEKYNPHEYIGSWTDGVVFLGGEATLEKDLEMVAKGFKEKGLAIKLDTNGSNPLAIKNLLEKKLVDYIAMDIKGPPQLYKQLTGGYDKLENIQESMKILSDSDIKYEFRTTIVPLQDEMDLRWLDKKDITDICNWVIETTKKNNHLYYLQEFIAQGKEQMIDELYSSDCLPESFHKTPKCYLNELVETAKEYLPNCKVR